MPLKTDLNVAPYFDDYDELKNYHRVMFRPSVAVQARELTQLQTILQNQIERFGNWAFRSGDIVSGCTITDIPVVPYVRLMDFGSNGTANTATITVTEWANAVVESETSGLKAKIFYANSGFSTNYPDTNILYLGYLNTGNLGEVVFSNNELLRVYTVNSSGNNYLANVYSWANNRAGTATSGKAHGITLSEGIVFINGNFVRVANSTFGLVNTFGTYAGNNVVGFDLNESIVTENMDTTLLDNALGYPNENAPGAHRLKLVPFLKSLDPEIAANTKGFNAIAVYNFGNLVSKSEASSNLYSIVGNVVAKRTFEESGNYVVNPFAVDAISTIGDSGIIPNNDPTLVLGRVSPGIGYAQGSRVELNKTAYISMRRGVDTETLKSQQITLNYGNYFVLNEVAGGFDLDLAQTVNLYDKPLRSITNKSYASLSEVTSGGVTTITSGGVTATKIGTATVRCFSFFNGSVGSAAGQYILNVYNIVMNTGRSPSQIMSVFSPNAPKGVGDVYSVGLQSVDTKAMIFSYGVNGVKNLRDNTAPTTVTAEYTYRTTNTSATMNTNGQVTVVLSASQQGGTDKLFYSNGVLTQSQACTFSIYATANADSANLTGTVSVTNSSVNVTGTGTTFLTNFAPGDLIKVYGDNDPKIIVTVVNNNFLTISSNLNISATNTAANYQKSIIAGRNLPINLNYSGGPNGYITVTNSTSFTITTGEKPSTSVGAVVTFDVLRTEVTPASKIINKHRYVKISTVSKPRGPWCLGLSDVHKLRKVYGTANGTYTTAGADITSNFTLDNGQRDTHYDLAYLYPKSSYSPTSHPNLLIEVDYFIANTQPGVGFFSVESYPVDDVNTANTNGITTREIPLYVTERGVQVPLRDVVDFRTTCINTANNTGNIANLSNTTQVAAAISYATLNPSSTLTFNVGAGLNTPSFGRNFESDITRYLPRKDLLLITPDNKLKVKEGISAPSPQTPLFPDNAMALATINIPPYPSLTSDQVSSLITDNQRSYTLSRDTSTTITTSLATNRRYSMKDIGLLDQRITNLEYYTQLSLLEKNAKDLTVTDENGLDRFKNGIFVDPFTDFSLSAVDNNEYSIAIDSEAGVARPKIVREFINIQYSSGTNVRKTGRLVTLNYTETPFMTQPNVTKYRSSALVAYAWNGTLTLIPEYDNNIDQNQYAAVNLTLDNATPWQRFANSPFGSVWGDWRTTTSTSVNTTQQGTANNINLNVGAFASGGPWSQVTGEAAVAAAVQRLSNITNPLTGEQMYPESWIRRNATFIEAQAGEIDINSSTWSFPPSLDDIINSL